MSKTLLAAACAWMLVAPLALSGQAPSPDAQIAGAVLGLPADLRDAATVVGWTDQGLNVILREGTNDMTCLADTPGDERFSSACYHDSLEPYMARGRDLRREGVTSGRENREQRWAEIESGDLDYPEGPALLYVYTADAFDPATGEETNGFTRSVIYYPYATPETTGVPGTPQGGGLPWIMYPGSVGAHFMITPETGGG